MTLPKNVIEGLISLLRRFKAHEITDLVMRENQANSNIFIDLISISYNCKSFDCFMGHVLSNFFFCFNSCFNNSNLSQKLKLGLTNEQSLIKAVEEIIIWKKSQYIQEIDPEKEKRLIELENFFKTACQGLVFFSYSGPALSLSKLYHSGNVKKENFYTSQVTSLFPEIEAIRQRNYSQPDYRDQIHHEEPIEKNGVFSLETVEEHEIHEVLRDLRTHIMNTVISNCRDVELQNLMKSIAAFSQFAEISDKRPIIPRIKQQVINFFEKPKRFTSSFQHFLVELVLLSKIKLLETVFPNVKFVFSSANEMADAPCKFQSFINSNYDEVFKS